MWPGTEVIILTTYDADDLVSEGIKAGARGYLLKDAAGETLAEAIRGVVRGESQLDPKVARKVLGEFQRLAAEGPSRRGGQSSQGDDLVIEPLTLARNASYIIGKDSVKRRTSNPPSEHASRRKWTQARLFVPFTGGRR